MVLILLENRVERKTPSVSLFNCHPGGSTCLRLNGMSSSQAARRDQNRIAQREFRLRKQQRVCLGSYYRVSFYLSRNADSRFGSSCRTSLGRERWSTRWNEEYPQRWNRILLSNHSSFSLPGSDLMQENQTLRNLLRSLGSFIGDGAGGLLPKLGWDMSDFNNFVSRSETDTAWESFQRRKKSQSAQPAVSGSQTIQGQKRPTEGESNSNRSKKARGPNDDTEGDRGQNGYSLLVPMHPPGANNIYPSASRPSHEGGGLFSNGSPMFMQPSPTTPQYSGTSSSNVNNYQSSYMPSINMNLESTLPPLPLPSASSNTTSIQQRMPPTNRVSPEQVEDDEDPNINEAYKLIQWSYMVPRNHFQF